MTNAIRTRQAGHGAGREGHLEHSDADGSIILTHYSLITTLRTASSALNNFTLCPQRRILGGCLLKRE